MTYETLCIWRFNGNGSKYVQNTFNKILSWLNIIKRNLTKMPAKLSLTQEIKSILSKTLETEGGVSLIIVYIFVFQANLVLKSYVVLLKEFSAQFV